MEAAGTSEMEVHTHQEYITCHVDGGIRYFRNVGLYLPNFTAPIMNIEAVVSSAILVLI
jgi:hypothetical protein